jgi:hypothetical protein
LTPLELTLAAAALLVGLTGAWSPCGFSMVETIGPTGPSGGRRTTAAACVTFTLGALVGGAATFGALSVLGAALQGTSGRVAYLVAAAIAVAAALGEARAMRIVPQVRRQLPEHWRRLMPMPVAAALYGILLGLGFTTFVLTLGVWALGGISVALGDPALGLLIGIAFGAGRAIPVGLIAPIVDRPAGVRIVELMAERPEILRGFRLGDALALALAAVVLTTSDPAEARTVVTRASNPSLAGLDFAFKAHNGTAMLRRGGRTIRLPGESPALGGPYIAIRRNNAIRLLSRRTRRRIRDFSARRVDAIAVSTRWLVYRRVVRGGERLVALRTSGRGRRRIIARVRWPAQLGRPSVSGDVAFFAVNGRRSNKIVKHRITTGGRRTAFRGRRVHFSNPSVRGGFLLYVRTTRSRQQLRLKRRGRRGAGRILYSIAAISRRDRGYAPGRAPHSRHYSDLRRSDFVLWSTALTGRYAYVTLVRRSSALPRSVIRRFRR